MRKERPENFLELLDPEKLPRHYFAADLHLNHKNILLHEHRPWEDIGSHDFGITEKLRPEACDKNNSNELWLMGDIAGSKQGIAELIAAIRPYWHKIHLIRGNHDDKAAWKMRHLFDSANEALYVRITDELQLYLSHYSHRVWRNSNHGSIHIHGHSHGALQPWGKSVDTYIGLNGFKPFSLRQILEKVKGQPNIDHHQPLVPEVLHTRIVESATGEKITFQRNGVTIGHAEHPNGADASKPYTVWKETDHQEIITADSEQACWNFLLGIIPRRPRSPKKTHESNPENKNN